MGSAERRMKAVERELIRLRRRVEKLEDTVSSRRPRVREPVEPSPAELSFINTLMKCRGPRYERDNLRGAVAYAGAVHFGDRQYLWIKDHGLPEIVEHEFDALAGVLSALSSLPRLIMLRSLLQGPRSSQELQAALGISSAGQLYHHLKDLLAAGLVVQSQRGSYQIRGAKMVSILAILAAAMDLTEDGAGDIGTQEISIKGLGPGRKAGPKTKDGFPNKRQPAGD